MADRLPRGLWPVMLTSFQPDGSIDWVGVDALTDWYISAGAAGLFAVCLSSEMYALTPDERLALARRVVERSHGRVPVVATGTYGGPIEEQAAFVRHMADTGVAAVVVITSQLVTADEDEATFRTRSEQLLDQTAPLPLGLYECPVPYKRLLSPEMAGWLAKTGRFLYLKDTSCDLDAIQAKVEAIAGTPLQLYNAHTPTALSSLECGAAGVSPIAGNYYPELFARLCQGCFEHPQGARDLQRMLTLMEGVARSGYPTAAKAFLQMRGLPIERSCRTQEVTLSPDDEMLLQSLWEVAGRLSATGGLQ
jgi:4-hydroxy-tetrahydrodipicolinate synthase